MTKIEWTNETWNPITGCSKISPGCLNCYAEKMAARLKAIGVKGYENGFNVTFHPERLDKPEQWKKPRMIFICSMGDLFHKDVEESWIDSIFDRIIENQRHTFQILTKRPERMKAYLDKYNIIPNLWVGVTAENQEQADRRLPILMQTRALIRFVSIEPMLETVSISRYLRKEFLLIENELDWVICGPETGPGARDIHSCAMLNLKNQCVIAGKPFFLKKMMINGKFVKMPLLDGNIWDQMPGGKI